MPSKNLIHTYIALPRDLHAAAKAQAQSEGREIQNWIRWTLRRALEKLGRLPKGEDKS